MRKKVQVEVPFRCQACERKVYKVKNEKQSLGNVMVIVQVKEEKIKKLTYKDSFLPSDKKNLFFSIYCMK